MSLIRNATQWFSKGGDLTAAGGPYVFGWYNAEVLNAAQFFLKYTGAQSTTVDVKVSPAEAHGRDVDPSEANANDDIEALASGDHSAEGFFDPPSQMDRPFQSFEVTLTVAADITDVYFGLCTNGAGE